MTWRELDAVLFDLDGVLTPTALVHMNAWREVFTAWIAAHGIDEPYTDADYFAHIDGLPRYDGVRRMLASRGISLPEGTPDDDPSAETVCGIGNRKNQAFTTVLERDGIEAYPGSVRFLDALDAEGIASAVVSSSRNARAVLATAGLAGRFTVIVDGVAAADAELPGKPAPDTFLRAAQLLHTAAADAAVFEDAVSGVAAGRAGDFGLVVGVDRGAGPDALRQAGADLVVADLAELLEVAS